MVVVIVIGAGLTLAGLGGLIWCIRHAAWMKRTEMDEEAARRATQRLVTGHMAAIGAAFLGLGLTVAGLLLG